jgi:outer membrane lipoprotein-sorting protein
MKKTAGLLAAALLAFLTGSVLFAQDVLTVPTDIFNKTSDLYAKFGDFQSSIRITKGDKTQLGTLYYNSRNMLKIEFYDPRGQVILITQESLQIYLPTHQTILEQKFTDARASLASSGGFALLKNNYSVSFAEPGLVPLNPGSSERVYKLSLYPYAGSSEGFKYIVMSVLPESFLIRRIEATNLKNEKITFEYDNIIINPGVPLSRYNIDTPNLTNVFPNFLYGAEK